MALTDAILWANLPLLVVLLAIGIAVHLACARYMSGLRHIPGPFVASTTNLWRLYDVSKDHHQDTLIRLHRQYASDVVRVGPNTVSIASPEAVKTIYGLRNVMPKVCSPF